MSEKKPKEVRVDSIITAAVEEFLEKGYDGASVNAIAMKAGVSKGGFYHHFPIRSSDSKDLDIDRKKKLNSLGCSVQY